MGCRSKCLVGALGTLTILEIVLGIDNIIFYLLFGGRKITQAQQNKARRIGLAGAMLMRLALPLLLRLSTQPSLCLQWRATYLYAGLDPVVKGLFLIWKKASKEIHETIEGERY